MKNKPSPILNERKQTIEFIIENECARRITLAGSFNHWAKDDIMLRKKGRGIWSVKIPMPPGGKYQYKFIIDDWMPMEDINNPYREPDGITGWNSVLIVGEPSGTWNY